MRKRTKVLIVVTCLAAAGTLVAFLARDTEPRYNGRSLSEWYILWTESVDDSPQRNEAVTAIRHIGTNALPIVLKHLRHQPSPLRTHLAQLADKLPPALAHSPPIAAILPEPSGGLEPDGIFEILGSLGSPAVPELTELLHSTNNPDRVRRAAFCLAAIGNDGMRPLLQALTNSQPPCCYFVAELFAYAGVIGPQNLWTNLAQAGPALVLCALGKDTRLATSAIEAFAYTEMEPRVALPVLTNSLRSPDPALRSAVVRSLSFLGDEGIPYLLAATNDPDGTVREAAIKYLDLLAPEALTNAPAQ